MSVDQLVLEFRNPPNSARFAPFWFLNHRLETDELIWQIREMHEKGVGGFVLHGRHGLLTSYMSAEWMDKIEVCVKEGARLGMKVYLYDENNWPSGVVDGQLIEQYPQYRMSGCVRTQETTIKAGKQLSLRLDVRDGLIAIIACPLRGGKIVDYPARVQDLLSFVEDGVLNWTPEEGDWRVGVYAREILRGGTFFGGYLDTLSRDAVGKFIEMTHEPYTRRFGRWFGGTIEGIFTDEPAMNMNPPTHLPWTPAMPEEFQWRKGYPLISALPALFGNVGPRTAQFRIDYFDVATDLYVRAYFKQTYKYCEERRLKFVGHVLYEGELAESARREGDFFRTAEWMHFGGCDLLCDLTWPSTGEHPAGLNNLVTPKLASSAAHLFDKPRIMCESFGLASQWSIDLCNLKRLSDWLIVLGINLLMPHAFYYSVQGFRKYECPPGEFYQSPFWPYYRALADYTGRLCHVLTGARHLADVAVLLPTRSLWAAMAPGPTPESEAIAIGFEKVTRALAEAGIDFDIIPEDVFQTGWMSPVLESRPGGSPGEWYSALVIPPSTAMPLATAEAILACLAGGGCVVAAGGLPDTLETHGREMWGNLVIEDLRKAFGVTKASGSYFGKASGEPDVHLYEHEVPGGEAGLAVFVSGIRKASQAEVTRLISRAVRETAESNVTIQEAGGSIDNPYVPEILHANFIKDSLAFYFFVNTSKDRSIDAEISFMGDGVIHVWDAATGEVVKYVDADVIDEEIHITKNFLPGESWLISVGEGPLCGADAAPTRRVEADQSIVLGPRWAFETSKPNCLPLTRWSLEMSGRVFGADGVGYWHTYRSEFKSDINLTDARLLLDGIACEKLWRGSEPVNFKCLVNGKEVGPFERGEYIDHYMMECDIGSMIKKGTNSVEISSSASLADPANLAYPAIVIGRFAVEVSGKQPKLIAQPGELDVGSWTDKGYPYFCGIGRYSTSVRLPRSFQWANLVFDGRPNDMAEIVVNGQPAGIVAWEPWEIDISGFAKPGQNQIEICVASSLQNLFSFTPKPSGILGPVRIEVG